MKALCNEKKEEIRKLHEQGYTHRQIARAAKVSAGSVSYVLQRRTKEQNKACNIPQSLWDECDILHERYGKKNKK